MSNANLYLDEINLNKYFSEDECRVCGAESCKDLVEKIVQKQCQTSYLKGLPDKNRISLEAFIDIERILPQVPMLQHPQAGDPGLSKINDPRNGDPILVTGNNKYTQEVLMIILSATSSPFFFLSADTRGDTLDMAIILNSFTADAVQKALKREGLDSSAKNSPLILPGHAAGLKKSIKELTGFEVKVGPVCAAELPLFFGDKW